MDERRRKRSRRHGAAACAALVFALSALLVPAGAVSAPDPGGETQLLVPVGKAIGVKLFAEGVLVVGLSENEGAVSPAKKGGMKAGDLILTMNDVTIGSTEHLQSLLAENGEREAAFGVRRGGRLVKLAVCPKKGQDGVCRLGAWIRDSMAGIGTVTFYDPQTGAFAALGHGITDVDTGKLMPLSRGSVMAASVKAVKRGASGSPGELRGDFDLTRDLGLLTRTQSAAYSAFCQRRTGRRPSGRRSPSHGARRSAPARRSFWQTAGATRCAPMRSRSKSSTAAPHPRAICSCG